MVLFLLKQSNTTMVGWQKNLTKRNRQFSNRNYNLISRESVFFIYSIAAKIMLLFSAKSSALLAYKFNSVSFSRCVNL